MKLKRKNVYFLERDENLQELFNGYDAAHITKGGSLSRPRLTEIFNLQTSGWYGPVVWAIRPSGIAVFIPSGGITRQQAIGLLENRSLRLAA